MELTKATAFLVTALFLCTSHDKGFVEAASTVTTMTGVTHEKTIESTVMAATTNLVNSVTATKSPTGSNSVASSATETSQSSIHSSASAAHTSESPTTENTGKSAPTTLPSTMPVSASSTGVEFHVIMIVMIIVLGFILACSICCGLLTVWGVDIGCPLPCCGSKSKSDASIPLKNASRKNRSLSSQRLNEAEEFREVDTGNRIKYKSEMSGYEGIRNPSYEDPSQHYYASLQDDTSDALNIKF